MHATSCSARSYAYAPPPADTGHHELWFDAGGQQCVDERWFDVRAGAPSDTRALVQTAEHLVPFTEDCRRAVKQLIQSLGEVKQNALIASRVARLLPVLAGSVATTALSTQRSPLCSPVILGAIGRAIGMALVASSGAVATQT